MSSYNGPRTPGSDYSFSTRDVLPELIKTTPLSPAMIAEKIGRSAQAVGELMAKLHREGLVHIAKWKRAERGPMIRLYLWGPGEDMKKPHSYTQNERCRRYRKTIRGQGVTQAIRAKNKIKTQGLAAVDPLMAAIMGL